MEKKTYDLNISERYVPSWGAWEIGREVISNAIDADPKNYKVEIVGPDHVRVTTTTAPTLAQIKFIGGGTKVAGGGTIGCFGEGIKLAAMVATRMGGTMALRFDRYRVGYELKEDEGLGARSAFMLVDEPGSFHEGTAVDLMVPNIAREVSGRFLQDQKPGPIEKRDPDKMVIYNKGVWVAEKPIVSIWDWNVKTQINRDRNVIDFWEIQSAIMDLLNEQASLEIGRKLLASEKNSFEVETMSKNAWYLGPRIRKAIMDAILDKYGTDIVIACSDADANKLARAKGKTVVILDDGFTEIIKKIKPEERPPLADEFVSHQDRLEVDYTPNKYDMADVNMILEALEEPVEVYVFEGKPGAKEMGLADFKEGRRRIYLSSLLFQPGRQADRLGTVAHEIAHVRSHAGDGDITFEQAMTHVAGKLARAFVEKGKK